MDVGGGRRAPGGARASFLSPDYSRIDAILDNVGTSAPKLRATLNPFGLYDYQKQNMLARTLRREVLPGGEIVHLVEFWDALLRQAVPLIASSGA